jgi:rhodanese-related sulfurtransferase
MWNNLAICPRCHDQPDAVLLTALMDKRLAIIGLMTVALLGAAKLGGQGVGLSLNPTDPSVTLADVETKVSKAIPAPETSVSQLAVTMSGPDTVLFDVRTPEEFAQSHLAGAILIDPEMSANDFAAKYGAALKGKTAIFYCAVGVRSGLMVQRVTPAIAPYNPHAVFNLRGGAFRWLTDNHPLVNQSGPIQSVHPYDAAWGQLLNRTLAAGRAKSNP